MTDISSNDNNSSENNSQGQTGNGDGIPVEPNNNGNPNYMTNPPPPQQGYGQVPVSDPNYMTNPPPPQQGYGQVPISDPNYMTNPPPPQQGYDQMPPASYSPSIPPLLITTAFELPNMEISQNLGIVYGIVARGIGAGKSIAAGFKAIAGGEIKQYTKLIEDSRRHAMDRMIDNAMQMGANAIISMRFDSSEITQGITEIVAYGTAVIVNQKEQ